MTECTKAGWPVLSSTMDINQLNKQIRLARYPIGLPKTADWEYRETDLVEPVEGEVLVAVRYIAVDPAMRGWVNPGKSYVPPVSRGEVMRAFGAGQVIRSRSARFAPGDFVSGLVGVQSYAVVPADRLAKVDLRIGPLPKHLSLFGIPGLAAYFGLLEVGQAKAGETVVVSSAAGAVGAIVGQIAKIIGCRVIGIAGGARKNAYVTQLGFDACIDYQEGPIFTDLARHCPNGVDVYFDNVGGDLLDAVLPRLRSRARVVICGVISQMNSTSGIHGPRHYMSLLVNRARMEGFVVSDFEAQYDMALCKLSDWSQSGRLKSDEDVIEGITSFPDALLRLFSGAAFGKLMLRVEKS
jgi:NADPH-dependent curcumin reductase CurA